MKKQVSKKKKSKYDIAYIAMVVVAVLIIIATGTYAYYQSTISGTVSGNIAKWSFKANNQPSTINIDYGGLYPGKTGVYNLELSAEDSELPVGFELILHYPTENVSAFNLFSNLFFDSSYIVGPTANGTLGLKGVIMPGEKAIIPIYYKWDYDPMEDMTEAGPAADGRAVSNDITIVGRQLDISNQTAFEESFYADMLGIIGTCSSVRYNYGCDFNFTYGNTVSVGDALDYTLADDNVMEFVTYMTAEILLQ